MIDFDRYGKSGAPAIGQLRLYFGGMVKNKAFTDKKFTINPRLLTGSIKENNI
ncbi:MAG: hypothetical protein KH509_06625 [Clostridium sp.]|nr:hypothetical protein [Clostridium sp.]